MVREGGLDEHFAGAFGTTGTTSHLRQRLRQALRRAEVCTEQALVGVQHHHECHFGEVVPLGQHLRAHEDARMAFTNPLQRGIPVATAADRIAVNAQDFGAGELVRQ